MSREYVNLNSKISDIVKDYPISIPLLSDMGMVCYSCELAPDETLEQASKVHQFKPEDIVEEINEWIEEKTKELKQQGLTDEDIKDIQIIPEDDIDFWDDDF